MIDIAMRERYSNRELEEVVLGLDLDVFGIKRERSVKIISDTDLAD
jgi:hypothetical protein